MYPTFRSDYGVWLRWTSYGEIANQQITGICDEINHEWLPDICRSARKAFRQFIFNERKLRQNREAKDQYNYFLQEMVDTCHIEKVLVSDQFLPVGMYFIMQFGVPDSTTTKCRAVFNGSAPTSNGKSLNDCLLVGPKKQPDLFNIFVRFRYYIIALSGDITKMYRQIENRTIPQIQKSTSALLEKRKRGIN